MKKLKTFLSLIAVTILLTASIAQAAEEINLSVPASMTDALKELITQFIASGKDTKITPNYGPSGTLAKQIVNQL